MNEKYITVSRVGQNEQKNFDTQEAFFNKGAFQNKAVVNDFGEAEKRDFL